MAPLTFGLMSLPADWEEARRHAALAEAAGCDSLWTGDHLRHPRDPEQPFLDGWSVLPAWAATTRRPSLGMLVSNLTYRHPAVLARQAAATDVISGGRLLLGIGTGVYDSDHAMAGVPGWSARERVERLGECLVLVDRLLRGEHVTWAGAHYAVADAVVRPRPVQRPRPPLVVGALGPRTIDLAVRHADTWNTWAGFHTTEADALDSVRAQVVLVDAACDRHGRAPASLRRSICLYPPFDPWRAPGALDRLVAVLAPLGFTELVLYPPPAGREDLLVHGTAAIR